MQVCPHCYKLYKIQQTCRHSDGGGERVTVSVAKYKGNYLKYLEEDLADLKRFEGPKRTISSISRLLTICRKRGN